MNFHCMNRNDRACQIDLEIYDTNHNIVYRGKEKQSGALKVEFRSRGDIFIRFTNQYVNFLTIFQMLIFA
jgi:hypothetical protein